jgi:hypothetical protein
MWDRLVWEVNRFMVPDPPTRKEPTTPREWFEKHLAEDHDNRMRAIHVEPKRRRLQGVVEKIMMDLFDREQLVFDMAEKPKLRMSSEELERVRRDQEKYRKWANYPEVFVNQYHHAMTQVLNLVEKHVPSHFTEEGVIICLLIDALRRPHEFMQKLLPAFDHKKPSYYPEPLFRPLLNHLYALKTIVGQRYKQGNEPIDYPNKDRRQLVEDFFRGTELEQLFYAPLFFRIPWKERHALIVAPSGHGKSQLIEALVMDILFDKSKPSIVIIDSKGGYRGLFERISHLECFAPDHGVLRDRLIIIDPEDEPALGAFAKAEGLKELLRAWPEAGEYTPRQQRIMNHIQPVIAAMKGNFTDAIDLINDPTHEKFQAAMLKVSPETKQFWATYRRKDHTQQIDGIESRLDLIRSTPKLGKMFNARENKLNFSQELESGKVILISTAYKSLEVGYSELLTNYFLSLVFSAGVRRDRFRPETFVIVDEALPIINDISAKNFITLREYNVHCVYAVQSATLLKSYWDYVGKNTDIKLVSALKSDEISLIKPYMGRHCTDDFLYNQKKEPGDNPRYGRFGCSIEGVTGEDPISLLIPFGFLNNRMMSDDAYRQVRLENRKRFAPTLMEPELAEIDDPETLLEAEDEAPPPPRREKQPKQQPQSDKPSKLKTPWYGRRK